MLATQVNIFLTYMGNRYLELEDVDNVHLKLHSLVYSNKIWTPRKFFLRIRRDIILDILSQVLRFYGFLVLRFLFFFFFGCIPITNTSYHKVYNFGDYQRCNLYLLQYPPPGV